MEVYKVNAFCKNIFSGNPAAVCLIEDWPQDELMQNIAAENNLADTAFCVREKDHYHIRWFIPSVEGVALPNNSTQIKESSSRWINDVTKMHQIAQEYYDP